MYRKCLSLRMLLGALLTCAWVPTAAARPASFAAIRTIELEPALPGTEKVYRQLAEQLAYLNDHPEPARDVYVRPEPAAPLSSDRLLADRNQQARCTLRTDLSKPRSIGLECVGDFVSNLLRVDGTWRVVASPETLSGDDADRLLECEVAPTLSATGPWWSPKTNAAMLLRNSAGEHVARVTAGSSRDIRRRLDALVRALLAQRRADEEIYRVSPDGNRSRARGAK